MKSAYCGSWFFSLIEWCLHVWAAVGVVFVVTREEIYHIFTVWRRGTFCWITFVNKTTKLWPPSVWVFVNGKHLILHCMIQIIIFFCWQSHSTMFCLSLSLCVCVILSLSRSLCSDKWNFNGSQTPCFLHILQSQFVMHISNPTHALYLIIPRWALIPVV